MALPLPLAAPYPILSGGHRIVVSAPGHSDFEIEIRTSAKELRSIEARLKRLGGMVRITCDAGRTARVILDGAQVGTCPYEGAHPSGVYRLEVEQPGRPPYSESIVLEDGERLERRVPEMRAEVNTSKSALVPKGRRHERLVAHETVTLDPPRRWRTMGWTSAVVGTGILAAGVVFNVKGAQHNHRAEILANRYYDEPNDDDFDEHHRLRTETIPRDRAWVIAGYSAGIGLLGAAAVMLYYDAKIRSSRVVTKRPERLGVTAKYAPINKL